MTPEEKVAFLKKMGYGGSLLNATGLLPASIQPREQKTRKLCSAGELYRLGIIFNVNKRSTKSCRHQIQEY